MRVLSPNITIDIRMIKLNSEMVRNKDSRMSKALGRNFWLNVGFAFFILLVVAGSIIVSHYIDETSSKGDTVQPALHGITGNSADAELSHFSIEGLLTETNIQRIKKSLSALVLNDALNASAQAKCNDMVTKGYFEHNTPDGEEPWIFIDAAGYKYSKAAENLADGFPDNHETIVGWMNSPGHRDNILNGTFQEVGFGFCKHEGSIGGVRGVIVVQHFGTPKQAVIAPKPITAPKIKPYVPSVCHKIPIPYKTIYINVSYLYVGETSEWGGTDGYTEICGPDSYGNTPSDFPFQPFDKTIYVG